MTKRLESTQRIAIGTRAKVQRNGWTPERRVRQAALIRGWQPWRRSTGPKTEAGKARCAMNALKHGHRSRATIEEFQRVRYAIRLAARNNEIMRLFIRVRDLPRRSDYVAKTGALALRLYAAKESLKYFRETGPHGKFQNRTNRQLEMGIAQFRQSPTKGPSNARMGMAALAPQAIVAAKEALSSEAQRA